MQDLRLTHHQLQEEMYLRREEFSPVARLLKIRLEEAKEGMVKCQPSELPRLQGAAIALDALLVLFVRPRAEIKKEEPALPTGTIQLW